jgi:hypothetical protein
MKPLVNHSVQQLQPHAVRYIAATLIWVTATSLDSIKLYAAAHTSLDTAMRCASLRA